MYVESDLFKRSVEALAELQDASALRVSFLPTPRGPSLVFALVERHPDIAAILGRHDVEINDVRETTLDLTDILSAIIGGAEIDDFVAIRSSSERWDDGEAEEPEIARTKWQLVHAAFDIDELRKRVFIKATTKDPIIVDL